VGTLPRPIDHGEREFAPGEMFGLVTSIHRPISATRDRYVT
jgi:hypothetical protein